MGEKNSVLKILGGVFAFLTVILFALLMINERYSFITGSIGNYSIIKVLTNVRDYMVLGSLVLCGLAFAPKKGIIGILLLLVYLAAIAVIVVFTFLPGVLWF